MSDHHRDQLDDGVPDDALFVPARATLALDMAALYGPEVDRAVGTWEGNPDGDVDAWELGEATPTRAQVRLLAQLTDRPIAWFYLPEEPWETEGVMWLCGRTGAKGMGRQVCQTVPMRVSPPAAEARGHQQGALF